MRLRAESDAKAAAERSIAAERTEIVAADDLIVEIAQKLPTGLRSRIAEVRKKLTAKIMSFERSPRPSDLSPEISRRRENPKMNRGKTDV